MSTTEFRVLCPVCRRANELLTSISDNNAEAPKVGDLTICANCGAILTWDTQMQVVDVPMEALPDITTPRMCLSLLVLQKAIRRNQATGN
jgi:hypothetical protein